MKKRLPWLIILLFLGLAVSTVVGVFETVVAVLPIVMCFQSLILIEATPSATMKIIMDPVAGDNITATGNGNLQVNFY